MAAPFKPNERAEHLVVEAEAALARALEPGHFAPAELVRRMSLEEQCAASLAEEDSAATPG